MPLLEREHTVVIQARRTAPHHDVAMLHRHPPLLVLALVAAEQEYGG